MTDVRGVRENRNMIFCPRCGKEHRFDGSIFDDIVNCSCGFDFYTFAADDLRIIMPWAEARCEPIVRAMRKLVVTTGRCTDIPPELYDNTEIPMLDDILDKALGEHQMENFGTCYISEDVLDAICESLSTGEDIELKWTGDHLKILELKKKNIRKKNDKSKLAGGAVDSDEITRTLPRRGLMFSPAACE